MMEQEVGSLEQRLADAIEFAKTNCRNAPYVPVRMEDAEAILTRLGSDGGETISVGETQMGEMDLEQVASAMRASGPFSWRVMQEGEKVAAGIAPNAAAGYVEASRYAMAYAQHGDIVVETRVGKGKWVSENGLIGRA